MVKNNSSATLILLIIGLLLLLFIPACSKTFVCYDGTTRDKKEDCPIVPYPKIRDRDAESAVNRFGAAYARAKGDVFTQVTSPYAVGGDWQTDILFSNTKTGEVHEAVLRIDGKSASITCVSGCEYMGLTPGEEPKSS